MDKSAGRLPFKNAIKNIDKLTPREIDQLMVYTYNRAKHLRETITLQHLSEALPKAQWHMQIDILQRTLKEDYSIINSEYVQTWIRRNAEAFFTYMNQNKERE